MAAGERCRPSSTTPDCVNHLEPLHIQCHRTGRPISARLSQGVTVMHPVNSAVVLGTLAGLSVWQHCGALTIRNQVLKSSGTEWDIARNLPSFLGE